VIPYVRQPALVVGGVAIHAFGICAAAALVAGYALVRRDAGRSGLGRDTAARLYVAAVLAGLGGGILWSALAAGGGISAAGLALGGLTGLAAAIRWRRLSFWSTLDVYAVAFPVVLAIARIGCFLAHDHIGRPTTSWLGVRFPGGTRWDLGLVSALSCALITRALVALRRWRPTPGTLSLASVTLLAASRLAAIPLARGS
jgi:phosphatidylglycerol---prolipoprotein diacylglyceryl transferase